MKINKIILSVSSLAVCGTLCAQDLRGVVRDADNQPLVGASVYWEGTTIGASTDAQGAFLLHRVKGYDNLVASYLGYVNDTLRVAGGAERIEFTLASEGVALEDVVVEGNLSGNFVKRDVGDRRVQRCHFGRTADQDARPGRYLHSDTRRKPPDHARAERPLRTELHARHVAQFDSGVEGRGIGDCRA